MQIGRPYRTSGIWIVLILIGACLPHVALAKAIRVEVHGTGATRQEAAYNALRFALRDGLTRFMGACAKHEILEDRIRQRFDQIRPDRYRPLVKRWSLDIDTKHKRKHYLEGTIRLDEDVLKLWTDQWLKDISTHRKGKRASLAHRLSLYIVPIGIGEGGLTQKERRLRRDFMAALEDRFLKSGYSIKNDAQKGQAHYRLQLTQAVFEEARDRHIGSMAFTVEAYENRSDGSKVGTAYDRAAASLDFTRSVLRNDLLQRSAVKVAAVLQEIFHCQWVPKETVEVAFYIPPKRVPDTWAFELQLLKGLAKIYGVRPGGDMRTFDHAVDRDITEKYDAYTFSYLIPNDYQVSPRQLRAALRELFIRQFKSRAPKLRSAEAGKKLVICHEEIKTCDGPAPVESWVVTVEQLIRDGKLDHPLGINSNALETVQYQLRNQPGDPQAIAYLERVSHAFVVQANAAMDKKQAGQAERYLNRAEHVLRGQSGLDNARQEVKQARRALKRLAVPGPKPSPSPPTTLIKQTPYLVFPQIEAKRRSMSRKRLKRCRKDIIGLVADVNGIASVTVNGKAVKFRKAANRDRHVLDVPGTQTQRVCIPKKAANDRGHMDIVVTNTKGRSISRTLVAKSGKFSLLKENKTVTGRRVLERGHYWALLIANQNYTNGIGALDTPLHDVEKLRKMLIKRYRFAPERVTVLKDATLQEMNVAFDRLHERVQGNDSLLIYYAGHGYQDKLYGGKGFWMPVDGLSPMVEEQSPRTTWFDNYKVHQAIEVSRAKHILLISDSCYAGTFKTRSILERQPFVGSESFFFALAAKTSRRAITSGDLEPVADGGAKGHSIFAYHLLRVLEDASGPLNARRLFERLQEPVRQARRQHPQYFTIRDVGDEEEGDFVFVPRR